MCLTDASLSVVVDGCEFFPAFSMLKTALEGWFSDQNRRAQSGFRSDIVPEHVVEMILTDSNGQPGPKTAYWLNSKGIYPDARGIWPGTARVASERADAVRSWSDPANVTASLRGLRGHPREAVLTDMLHGLVQRHAPQNLGLFDSVPVPVAFPPGDALFGEG
jgi:hypothetical protein